jgi:hypothetical protein
VNDRKTHANQRDREQFICQICGDGLSSNAKLSYHIQAKHNSHNDSKDSSSSNNNTKTTITVKNVKIPSPLPRAAASVPLASRPRVIARIARKSNAAAAAALASAPPNTSGVASVIPYSFTAPQVERINALVAATSSIEEAEATHDDIDTACGDDLQVKREPLVSVVSSAPAAATAYDLHYVEDVTSDLRRSTRLILICSHAGCGAIFHSRPGLARHERLHIAPVSSSATTSASRVTCGECKYECQSQGDLRQHEIDVHGAATNDILAPAGPGPYPCTSCGQFFKRRGNLVRHVKLQVCHSLSSTSRVVMSPTKDAQEEQTSVARAATPQLIAGGFFAPAEPVYVASSYCPSDKDATTVQQSPATVTSVVPTDECPLLMFGEDGDSSPVHSVSPQLVDPMMEALPSGMAMNGSPMVTLIPLPTSSVSSWPLLDDPLSFDIYTLDPSLFQY